MIETKKKDEFIALGIRLWFAGAVSFMIIWTTQISFDYLDMLFILIITHFVLERYVIIPIIKGSLKTRTSYFINYTKDLLYIRILKALLELFKTLLIVLAVIWTYELLNVAIINIFKLSRDQIVIANEPITYALFYNLYFYLLYYIHTKIIEKRRIKNGF